MKEDAVIFQPIGDVFLNLLFTIIVPLIFFTISSSIANMNGAKRLVSPLIWKLLAGWGLRKTSGIRPFHWELLYIKMAL